MANILIADDSIVMRKRLSTILTNEGHIIVGEASNGRQAVSLYGELKPDLVTMDISMPILSGVEAVQQIIAEDPTAKIVMISSVNQKKIVFNALNSGALNYIVKPIEEDKVTRVINGVLSSTHDTNVLVDSVESEEQGFEIKNIDGAFVVRFNDHLGIKDHSLLEMAIRGIMFIKPLNVIMDFTEAQINRQQIISPIIDLAQKVKDVEGNVVFKTQDPKLLEQLKTW